MDTTINLGLSKPDYDNVADIEVLNGNADIIDGMFDGSHVVMSVNDIKPINGNVQVDLGVTSFNGQKGAVTFQERTVKNLIDIIYPVGSYYDTSDKNFNPNTAWGGTWVKITDGRTLIAGGGTYNIGTNYGELTHKLTVAELPSHNHSASAAEAGNHAHTETEAGNHTHTLGQAGNHTHSRGSMNITGNFYFDRTLEDGNRANGAFYKSTTLFGERRCDDSAYQKVAYIEFDASKTWSGETSTNGNHTHTINSTGNHKHTINSNGNHTHTITIGNTGSNISFSMLQPSTAVARWHRTA